MNATHPAGHSPYKRIGGDAGIRKLVDRLCTLMDELLKAYAARKIHPADLTESANKLFDFLSGWLGGPQRYVEKHNHPKLRRRHAILRARAPHAAACVAISTRRRWATSPLSISMYSIGNTHFTARVHSHKVLTIGKRQ